MYRFSIPYPLLFNTIYEKCDARVSGYAFRVARGKTRVGLRSPAQIIPRATHNAKLATVEYNLRRIRLTINELNMKLREKNIFSLADVEFAILEPDGQLSVLPRSDKHPLSPLRQTSEQQAQDL